MANGFNDQSDQWIPIQWKNGRKQEFAAFFPSKNCKKLKKGKKQRKKGKEKKEVK